MAKRTESLASRTPLQVNPLARAFPDPYLQTGQLSQLAASLLASNDPVQVLEEITPENQKTLIDEIDKVLFSFNRFFPLSSPTPPVSRPTWAPAHET